MSTPYHPKCACRYCAPDDRPAPTVHNPAPDTVWPAPVRATGAAVVQRPATCYAEHPATGRDYEVPNEDDLGVSAMVRWEAVTTRGGWHVTFLGPEYLCDDGVEAGDVADLDTAGDVLGVLDTLSLDEAHAYATHLAYEVAVDLPAPKHWVVR